jgi:hypothetical protein
VVPPTVPGTDPPDVTLGVLAAGAGAPAALVAGAVAAIVVATTLVVVEGAPDVVVPSPPPASRFPTAGTGSFEDERRRPKLAAPATVASASTAATVPPTTSPRLRSTSLTVGPRRPKHSQPKVRDR